MKKIIYFIILSLLFFSFFPRVYAAEEALLWYAGKFSYGYYFPSAMSACVGRMDKTLTFDSVRNATGTSAECWYKTSGFPEFFAVSAKTKPEEYKLETKETEKPSGNCSVSNPIDLASGNKYQVEPVIQLSALQPLNFNLYFSSQRAEKWRHTFNRSVIRVSELQVPSGLCKQQICTQNTGLLESPGGFGTAVAVSGTSISSNVRLVNQCIVPNDSQIARSKIADACTLNWASVSQGFQFSWINGSSASYLGGMRCAISDSSGMQRMVLNVKSVHQMPTYNGSFNCSDLDPTIPPSLNGPEKIYLRFTRHNGRLLKFIYNKLTAELENISHTGERAELISNANTIIGYRLFSLEDEVEEYDLQGKLLNITNSQGLKQSLSYITDSITGGILLDRVSNSTGEFIAFSYETLPEIDTGTVIEPAFNRIQLVTDHTGRSWGFRYDNNDNLAFIDNPDNTSREYVYEDLKFTDYLTGIIDEQGNRYASWRYNSIGKAISGAHGVNADIERVTINYNDSTNIHKVSHKRKSAIDGLTTSIDSTYKTHAVGGVKMTAEIITGNSSVAFDYNPATGNLASKTEYGVKTTYSNYDSKGSPGQITQASNSPEQRVKTYSYDSRYQNKVSAITEPSVYELGFKTTHYNYDDFSNIISIITSGFTPQGAVISRSYSFLYNGPYHQLTEINGPRSNVSDITLFEYYLDDVTEGNNRARLRSVRSFDNKYIRNNITYTATGKIESEDRTNGLHISYLYYSGNDRLKEVIQTDTVSGGSRASRWTYLATGEVASITQGAGTVNSTTLTLDYDPARRLNRITDGLGNYISYVMDSEDNIEKEEVFDSSGILKKTLSQTFDIYNRLENFSQLNENKNITINPDGTVASVRNAKNVVSNYSYDNLKRLSQMTHDQGGTNLTTANAITQYGYDVQDHLTSVTDANNGTTSYDYDDLGNLLSQTSPDTGSKIYTYDAAGNLIQAVDAKNQIFTYSYDAYNRLTLVDAPGTLDDVSYTYDNCNQGFGKLCNAQRNFSEIIYQYNAYGDITNLSQGLNGAAQTINFTYQEAGKLKTLTYPNGNILTYTYDLTGNIKDIELNQSGVVTQLLSNALYEPFGALTQADFGNGLMQKLTHYTNYRPDVFELDKAGLIIWGRSYNYNNINLLNSITDEDTTKATQLFIYDEMERLDLALCSASYGSLDYSYDIVGNRTSLVSNNVLENYGYETNSNRLNKINTDTVKLDANGNIIQQNRLTYNHTADNRLSTVVSSGVLKGRYKYNAIGQRIQKLTSVKKVNFFYRSISANRSRRRRPAVNGNTIQKNTPTYTRITSNKTVNFLYGLKGELLGELDNYNHSLKYYIYHNANLIALLDYDKDNDGVADEFDNCINKKNPHQRDTDGDGFGNLCDADFNNDGIVNVLDLALFRRNYSSTDANTDLNGDGIVNILDRRIFRRLYFKPPGPSGFNGNTPSAELYYIHNDHLGTPKMLTNTLGQPVWRATTRPFGLANVNDDVDGDGVAVVFNIRQPGQYFDAESGLYYNYFRYYDPETGRYVTSDPIGLNGGINTYSYVANNPLKYTDPLGLWIVPVARAIATAIAAVVVTDTVSTCSNGANNAIDGMNNGRTRREMFYRLDVCLANPQVCSGAMAEEISSAADDAFVEGIRNTQRATVDFARSIPGTSITGPVPTNRADIIVGSAVGAAAQ